MDALPVLTELVKQRSAELRNAARQSAAHFSPSHPDVLRLQSQARTLENELAFAKACVRSATAYRAANEEAA